MIHLQWFHPGDNGCCQYLSLYFHGGFVQRLPVHCQPFPHNRPRCWIVRIQCIRIGIDLHLNIVWAQSQKVYSCYIQLTLDLIPLDHTQLLNGSSWLTPYCSQMMWHLSHWPRCLIQSFRLTTHSNDHILYTCWRKDCYPEAEIPCNYQIQRLWHYQMKDIAASCRPRGCWKNCVRHSWLLE